jgi:glycosyltransferase involved in cell wall biosynthesis
MRPKILMIPSWYPTKENPIHGSFFQEQALALSNYFEFCILHVNAVYISFKKYLYIKLLHKSSIFFRNDKVDDNLLHFFASYYVLSDRSKIISVLRFFCFNTNGMIKKQKDAVFSDINKYLIAHNFPADLIYAMTAQVNGVDAYHFGKINNIPVILAEHAPFPLIGTVISDDLREAISRCDGILAVSYDKARQILMQNIDCKPIVVGNMVNETIFKPSKKIKKKNEFTILIVALYNFYKDYDTFFHAIAYLRQITDSKFKVKIVGYMPYIPARQESIWVLGEREFFEHLNKYQLQDICELIPMVHREEMADIYNQSDVFVMTSIQEGLSVSALEASACGLPVFSTRCGGVEDYITDDYGRLFNIQDWKTIAESLYQMIKRQITFDGDRIRENVIARYGLNAFTERLHTIFTGVICEHRVTHV